MIEHRLQQQAPVLVFQRLEGGTEQARTILALGLGSSSRYISRRPQPMIYSGRICTLLERSGTMTQTLSTPKPYHPYRRNSRASNRGEDGSSLY